VFASFQTRLIFPGGQTQGQPLAEVRPEPGTELLSLRTTNGDRVVALFGPALHRDATPIPEAAECPTLLYFYGNAMCLRNALGDFELFRRLGMNVLIPDYTGYGMSGGQPSESGCQATADAAYDYLRSDRKIPTDRIVVGGWSLGAAVAIDLASRRPVGGLFAFCTFTRMADMARRVLPFLPTSLLLRHRFDNLAKMGQIRCPILLGHGRVDRIIPFEMSERLADAAGDHASAFVVEQADHNDFYAVGDRKIEAEISAFLNRIFRSGQGAHSIPKDPHAGALGP
jgi:fermentation-respiration switch protein FrsA (DUF1100 family)